MFSTISRYRKLDDVVVSEGGRTRQSKALRLLPAVEGVAEHVLSEDERLDHLAFKIYRQPRNWWRICDANPSLLSPRELFGTAPLRTAAYSVRFLGAIPRWANLFAALRGRVGVGAVEPGHPDQPLPMLEVFEGAVLFDIPAALAAQFEPSIFAQQLTVPLEAALTAGGLTLSTNLRVSQVAPTRWRIHDRAAGLFFVVIEDTAAAVLQVMDTVTRHTWVLTVTYNERNLSAADIRNQIESLGFEADAPSALTRIGKKIAIPPAATG
jgi:hypothetical protein